MKIVTPLQNNIPFQMKKKDYSGGKKTTTTIAGMFRLKWRNLSENKILHLSG